MWIIVSIAVIYLYYRIRKFLTYWKRNGVPQYPILQTLRDNFQVLTQKLSQAQLFQNSYNTFSDHRYFGIYQLFQKFLVVNDPELVKQITVKDFDHFMDHSGYRTDKEPLVNRNLFALKGKEWKDMRVILDTAFTSSKMKLMFDVLQTHCEQFVTYFQNQTENEVNCESNIKKAFGCFTSDVIADMVFGYKYNSLKNPNNDFYVKAKLLFPVYNIAEKLKRILMFTVPSIANYFGVRYFSKTGTSYFEDITCKNVQEREVRKIVRGDIIHALIDAKAKGSVMNLKNIDLAAHASAFYFAGTDTTVSTLCFISYELASNIQVQKRLQIEIDEVAKTCEGNLTYTALQEMKYMHMVVLESLRKWLPLVIDRKCSKPYVIPPKHDGEVPVHIKKGDTIWIPIRAIQRNPTIYPNPEEFDPERFNDENKLNINSYRFCPFGVGPRACIAKRFVLIMIKLLVFYVLKNFDILTNDKSINPNQFGDLSVLSVAIPEFWLTLKLRKKNHI